ncbi:MAG: DUF5723 family protein [Bacteroidetes bacterium]|nr:DUF5723 family protein [Bacteroidota bacterium]
MRRYILVLLILISFIPEYLRSQELLGLVNSNFADVNGILINPGQLVNSKLYLDINVFTADAFFDNNYLYIHKEDYRFLNFFRKNITLPEYGENNNPVDHYWDNYNKYFNGNIRLIGPSAMMVRGWNAFAIQCAIRMVTTNKGIPYHLANFIYEDMTYTPQQDTDYSASHMRAAALAWGEIGFSYSRIIMKFQRNSWTAGITVKRLFGYSGGYVNGYEMAYQVPNDSTLYIGLLNTSAGLALDMDYETNDVPYGPPLIKGYGFSFDLGVTFQKKLRDYPVKPFMSLCTQGYEDYLYRLGISLLDIGWIRFTSNAQKHDLNNVPLYTWNNINQFTYTTVNDLFHELSGRFYGDSMQSLVAEAFTMFLPSAMSVQFDYHYYRGMYFNVTLIAPLPLSDARVTRTPVLAITARYESPLFEMNLPLILYNLRYPRIGLSMRFWNLTIGTDKLFGFFHFTDFTGLDLYASLKLNFPKGKCISFKRKDRCRNMEF